MIVLVGWIALGLLGLACVAAGVVLEAREQGVDLPRSIRALWLDARNQDRTTGERAGRTRTGE